MNDQMLKLLMSVMGGGTPYAKGAASMHEPGQSGLDQYYAMQHNPDALRAHYGSPTFPTGVQNPQQAPQSQTGFQGGPIDPQAYAPKNYDFMGPSLGGHQAPIGPEAYAPKNVDFMGPSLGGYQMSPQQAAFDFTQPRTPEVDLKGTPHSSVPYDFMGPTQGNRRDYIPPAPPKPYDFMGPSRSGHEANPQVPYGFMGPGRHGRQPAPPINLIGTPEQPNPFDFMGAPQQNMHPALMGGPEVDLANMVPPGVSTRPNEMDSIYDVLFRRLGLR